MDDQAYNELLDAFHAAQSEGKYTRLHMRLSDAESAVVDPERALDVQIMLAATEDELGLMEKAQHRLERARRELAPDGSPRQRQRLAYYLVTSYVRSHQLGDAAARLPYFEAQLGDDPRVRSLYAYCEGLVSERRGDHAEALDVYRRAQRLAEAADDTRGVAAAASGTARVHLCRGDFRLARLALGGATDVLSDDPYHEAYNRAVATFALVGEGRFDEAHELGESTWEDANQRQLPVVAGRTALLLAVTRAMLGEHDAAEKWLHRAALQVGADPDLDQFMELVDAWLSGDSPGELDEVATEFRRALAGEDAAPWRRPFAAVIAACHRHLSHWTLDAEEMLLRGPAGEEHDLSRRGPMRRILLALAGSSRPLETGELFDAGWPEIQHVGPNGLRRVYTEVDRLRKLGFSIANTDRGYRLETPLSVD